ncbi:MAG: hypothetical protein ACW99J_16175 [Candidatus Thorarchaeota archaeon]|jgi:hypothetical protein
MEIIDGRIDEINVPLPLDIFMDVNQRFAEEDIHGGLFSLSDADTLGSGDDISVTAGIGKIMLVVNAGSDMIGDVTITGTTVNRDTKVETADDTDVLTLAGATTDTSSTDAESNVIHGYTKAYLSSKWFKGAITISTSEVTLTDVDVWQVAFEQLDDAPLYTVKTLDVTGQVTNTNAWGYWYLYSLEVTGDQCDIVNIGTVALASSDATANKFYRLRHSNLNKKLAGTTDGVWLEQFLGPNNQKYWIDTTVKVWVETHVKVPI